MAVEYVDVILCIPTAIIKALTCHFDQLQNKTAKIKEGETTTSETV